MKSLSRINVTDMDTLLQLSGTTHALTQNFENISPTTQVRPKSIFQRTYQPRSQCISLGMGEAGNSPGTGRTALVNLLFFAICSQI